MIKNRTIPAHGNVESRLNKDYEIKSNKAKHNPIYGEDRRQRAATYTDYPTKVTEVRDVKGNVFVCDALRCYGTSYRLRVWE